MRKKIFAALIFFSALLLGGCAQAPREESPAPTEAPSVTEARGLLGEKVQERMAAYRGELNIPALKETGSLVYTIPGDMLNQMALDARETGAEAQDGRWRFTWRQDGEYAYEATADDAPTETAAPGDETPMDSQLNGDYAVSGGGLFRRERSYDCAEDLSFGRADITDTLNGDVTGREVFRFCLRGKDLYFADATLNVSFDQDGLPLSSGFLAAVGVLRPDGLDIVEYGIDTLDALPDPASLDFGALLSSVEPLSRLTAQKDRVESR